uniref:Uncharacterized protein n=1 Tax=Rhizobium meliloti TaxID=382 RepID=I2E236_RHIML|nr:short hypothetical protein [Sinorhizobium meliloti]
MEPKHRYSVAFGRRKRQETDETGNLPRAAIVISGNLLSNAIVS